MKLKQKGSSAHVSRFKQLLITMRWTTAADFDLCAVYETKAGKKGLVYFGNMGDLNGFPFMRLSGDEGVNDEGGDNEEQLRITSLDMMKYIWILCWDFGKVQAGQPARFRESDVSLTVMDDRGRTHEVNLDTGETGNVSLLATIDCSNPVGASLINTSKAGTLKGMTNFSQLVAIIEQ